MNIFKKLFNSSTPKQKPTGLLIYVDAGLKKSFETVDQTIANYHHENNFDSEQYLYLVIINVKTSEVITKRKLNPYEKLSDFSNKMQDCKGYIINGYGSERSTIPRISAGPMGQNMRFIRAGTLNKYCDLKNNFEECQLRLHHDYLTFFKFKQTLSFMPLENSGVEIVNEKKNMFTVRDKFNSIIFKTSSKEDMYSWVLAINEAIKIRNSQIYMNQMEERLQRSTKNKLQSFITKCSALKDQSKVIPLDDIGRKALKTYFRKQKTQSIDTKLLSIVQAYLHMCKCRRQQGQQFTQEIIVRIKQSMRQTQPFFPKQIAVRDLDGRNQFVKTIEQIMKHLDLKYRKQIIDKRNISGVFQSYLVDQYRQDKKIIMKTLFGNNPY